MPTWDTTPPDGREELRLVLDHGPADQATLAPLPLHLGPWSLEEAAARADREAARHGKSHQLLAAETGQSQAVTETGRARPRPHVRIAHWHTYRTGKGRANRVLRWVPPIAVNLDPDQGLPATIRRVKKT